MKFTPKLSNIQTTTLFRIKKLLKSEWSEEIILKGKNLSAVDIGDSDLKLSGKLLNYMTEDSVIDFDNNEYPLLDLMDKDLSNLNKFLNTFIFEDEVPHI